jgi:hypothetical protein
VPVGKKMANQITNAIENPANDRISGASPHQQVTTVMTVTVLTSAFEGLAMKTMMLSALIVVIGIGLSGCAQPGDQGAHPGATHEMGRRDLTV